MNITRLMILPQWQTRNFVTKVKNIQRSDKIVAVTDADGKSYRVKSPLSIADSLGYNRIIDCTAPPMRISFSYIDKEGKDSICRLELFQVYPDDREMYFVKNNIRIVVKIHRKKL